MGLVDLHNMLVELYRVDFRSKRYYIRIIFHILDMWVVNARLLYRQDCTLMKEKYKALIDLKVEIAFSLNESGSGKIVKGGRPSTSPVVTKKRNRGTRPMDSVRLDLQEHWPIPQTSRRRCAYCSRISGPHAVNARFLYV